MSKVRIYELAKELNTTSKRLMEKLAEINIVVKNHMSLLEEHELEALYKHIGVIGHGGDKGAEEEKKAAPLTAPPKTEQKKDTKNVPRIIRKTEIIIDSKSDAKDGNAGRFEPSRSDARGGVKSNQVQSYVRPAAPTSGLRPGYVRDTGIDFKKDFKSGVKPEIKPLTPKEPPKVETRPNLKTPEQKDAEVVKNVDVKKDAKQEEKETAKQVKASIDEDVHKKQEEMSKKPEEKKEEAQDKQEQKGKDDKEAKKLQQAEHKPPVAKEQANAGKAGEQAKDKDVEAKKQGGRHQAPRQKKAGESRDHANRNAADRAQGSQRSAIKPLEIPKPEYTSVQKAELSSQRSELKREFPNKDIDKDMKREQKREAKGASQNRDKKFKPQKIALGQKKGVSEILDEDFILDEFYGDEIRVKKAPKPKKNEKASSAAENKHVPPKAVLTSITIPESITVKDLAEALKKTSTEVIKKLMSLGMMVTLNQEIDFDTASIVADEFGVKTEKQVVVSEEDILFDDTEDKEEDLVPRPPVVVVMGHVDHGKTSLLDAIRETNVIDTEAGGITQHIGAYTVKINNRNITFLDTPGHEAFTAMRARGAQVTDIAILVVAADDGVMPQTIEAINHAKAANVTIIVAINKIDKPGANPEKVKQELTEYGLVAEDWGGDTIMVPVSAKKRINIDHLLEMVLLAADMLELKANPNRQAKGTVIEAKLDKAKGPIATVLVQRGTLKVGDSIVTGTTVGRVRAMMDDKGHKVKKAGPSTPVEILGLPEVPEAGEIFYAVTDEKIAKQLAEKRKLKQREQQLKASAAKVSLDDLFNQIKEGKVKELNIIVKADVQGSVEALKQSLEKLSNDEVRIRIIHGGVGAITESDVTLAEVSNAIIIGFNVRPGANVAEAAQNAGVDIRLYRVIYNAIEDIQAAMKGMLEPAFKEVVLGHAEVRQIFKVSGVGTVGGCYVTDGKITRNSEVRIVRNGIVVHEGRLESLKRFKDDVREVVQGFECGLSIEKYNDIKEGDVIEAFIMEEVAR